MVLAAASPINAYVGNGSANTFPFTFPVFDQSVLLVTAVNATLGSSSTLVIGIDYTVTGLNAAGDPASTGNVVLVSAGQAWLSSGNLATNWSLVIQINTPLAQTFSIRNQGDYLRGYLENALDSLAMQIQQLELAIGSQLILPTGLLPSAFSPVLPSSLPSNAGYAIVVNPTGTGFSLAAAAGAITVPVSIANGGTNSAAALSNTRLMISKTGKIIEADGSDYSMNSGKITSLKNGSVASDAAAYGQLPGQVGTITNWVAYTPTLGAGFGTATSLNLFWRRVGDTVEIRGTWVNGTVGGGASTITLPNAIVTDNSGKIPSTQICGSFSDSSAVNNPRHIIAAANSNTVSVANGQTSVNELSAQAGVGCTTTGATVAVQFWVPINGWTI